MSLTAIASCRGDNALEFLLCEHFVEVSADKGDVAAKMRHLHHLQYGESQVAMYRRNRTVPCGRPCLSGSESSLSPFIWTLIA